MSTHEALSAASNDRKARLAQLKSLKRKQAPDTSSEDTLSLPPSTSTSSPQTTSLVTSPPSSTTILSGRNFDPLTRNVKLGFTAPPIADPTSTLEHKAQQLALTQKTLQQDEETQDKPLDLFKLQPKKPNWDLKRDLEGKMRGLDVQTDNAVARLVRERVEGQKRVENGEGETVGMEGVELVEAMHLKEREEEEERMRDGEEDG